MQARFYGAVVVAAKPILRYVTIGRMQQAG